MDELDAIKRQQLLLSLQVAKSGETLSMVSSNTSRYILYIVEIVALNFFNSTYPDLGNMPSILVVLGNAVIAYFVTFYAYHAANKQHMEKALFWNNIYVSMFLSQPNIPKSFETIIDKNSILNDLNLYLTDMASANDGITNDLGLKAKKLTKNKGWMILLSIIFFTVTNYIIYILGFAFSNA